MLKQKPQSPYWTEFSSYQTFETVDEMIAQIKLFEATYILTPSMKAVLNTIKLHAKKTFIGVCWLYREEIAKKAKVSLASVKRAIKALKEAGILKVYPHIHTLRGGQTHNVYVINPIMEPASEPGNEPPVEAKEEPSNPDPARECDTLPNDYKNPHTNSNTKQENHLSIKKVDELKFIPNEFIDLLEPFYANQPGIIRDRWKTVCVAAKRSGLTMDILSWDSVGQAWKDVIRFYKRGKIKNSTDDGIGAYFYGVLCDYLLNDCLRSLA